MFRFRALSALLLASLAAAVPAHAPAGASRPVIGAYYPGYAAERYPVSRIPAARITHLFYAFARIEQGECRAAPDAGAHFAELAALKRAHPHLRTLISIGGWEADGFSDAALTVASRERFVASCIGLFFDTHRGSFDGVDLDWEFPVTGGPPGLTARPQDRRNMTLLAREFRRQLDAFDPDARFLLTAALPAGRFQASGPYEPARSFELAALARTLDFINLMTYDMGTASLGTASLNAPLREDPAAPLAPALRRSNTVEGAVDYYLARGVPARQLVLGVPFHGRGYRLAPHADGALYEPFQATFEAGTWRSISTTLLADPEWRRHWHPFAQSPWLYHAGERSIVSYEDPASIALRAGLARDRGLRGVFMWELTGDDDRHSLLQAMTRPFRR